MEAEHVTKVTHTHKHRHTVPHPDAFNRDTDSEPHEHEHSHTSEREAGWRGQYGPHHRMHKHEKTDEPQAYRPPPGFYKLDR